VHEEGKKGGKKEGLSWDFNRDHNLSENQSDQKVASFKLISPFPDTQFCNL